MKNVRTVIWDCDGLMWFHRKEEAEIVGRALGIAEIEEFIEGFYSFFTSFISHFETKKVTRGETFKLIEKEMPILYFYGYTPKQFLTVISRLKFLGSKFNEDTLILMEYLSEKGIKNIIKTDWWRDVQVDYLQNYGIIDYIEELHCCDNAYLKCNPLSAEGIVKPGREEQYVIIGDSLITDIAFAKHAGIKSIWFNHNGEKQNNTVYQPTEEVPSLLDVMKII